MVDQTKRGDAAHSSGRLSRISAPAILGALGAGILAIASQQPGFVDGRIGPGLFAQVFALSVVALALLWAALAVFSPSDQENDERRLPWLPGLCLIGAVAAFIVLRPIVGLVPTAGAVALLASLGAGDRSGLALIASVLIGGLVAWVIGQLLLPPTTALWPWSPHL